MTDRSACSRPGTRHVWQFERRNDGTLVKRCVWCKAWYEEQQPT